MARTPEDPQRSAARTEPERAPESGNGRHRSRATQTARHVRGGEDDAPPAAIEGNGSAIAALVLGMLGLTLAFLVFPAPAAVLMGLAALILGVAGLRKASRLGGLHKGLSVTGLVTGALALLLGAAIIVGGVTMIDDLRERMDSEDIDLPAGG